MTETARYHRELVGRLRALLGEELVGVYAGGSYALGDYDPRRSDLDVAAVCRRPLEAEPKTRIADALRHESLPCPARGLELVLYPEATVRTPTADAGYELNLNTGREMRFHLSLAPGGGEEHWFAIDRAILREHGVALFGRPAAELFAAIPRETVLALLVDSVRWHEDHETRGDDAVLNACRAWRFAAEGVWSSKREAGEWARDRPGDPELVSSALGAHLGGGQPDRDRVGPFLGRVRRLLDEEALAEPA